jgi:hypothetical protein
LTRAMAFATRRLRDVDLDRGARSVGRSVARAPARNSTAGARSLERDDARATHRAATPRTDAHGRDTQ